MRERPTISLCCTNNKNRFCFVQSFLFVKRFNHTCAPFRRKNSIFCEVRREFAMGELKLYKYCQRYKRGVGGEGWLAVRSKLRDAFPAIIARALV